MSDIKSHKGTGISVVEFRDVSYGCIKLDMNETNNAGSTILKPLPYSTPFLSAIGLKS